MAGLDRGSDRAGLVSTDTASALTGCDIVDVASAFLSGVESSLTLGVETGFVGVRDESAVTLGVETGFVDFRDVNQTGFAEKTVCSAFRFAVAK